MHNAPLLQDLAIVVAVAGVMILLCHLLRQPAVLGYLLAGLIIGPHTPPISLIHDAQSIHTLAELGLVFLMFVLGLEFSLPKLRRVGLSAALATALEVAGMMWVGYEIGKFFGWSSKDSIFLGGILAISSTTIIVKVFTDLKLMTEDFAQVVFGILILEDVVAVLLLSVLSGLGTADAGGAALALRSLLNIGFFIILFLVIGLWSVPRLLHWIARFHVREILGIVSLAICLVGAILASLFGFSIALGAFLAGAVIAASREAHQIEDWIHPVRDLFSAIFFVAVGMMINPAQIWQYKVPILLITLATILGKTVTVALGAFLAGYGVKKSFKIGVSMAQIGEFSFVIASLGASLRITSDFLYPLAVAVSSVTTFCTPYLIRNSAPLVNGLTRVMPARLTSFLDRYETWLRDMRAAKSASSMANVFSGYIMRLAVYASFLLAAALTTRVVAKAILRLRLEPQAAVQAGLWGLSALFALPLFTAVTRYLNHSALILLTRTMESSPLFSYLNIQYFYNTMQVIALGILAWYYMFLASSFIHDPAVLFSSAGLLIAFGLVCRPWIRRANDLLESMLDEVFGLATSEPMHRAAILAETLPVSAGSPTAQFVVREDSRSARKTIRSLDVRRRTGVTILGIYRAGRHIANPDPDMQLQPNDVLVVCGTDEQQMAAAQLLISA